MDILSALLLGALQGATEFLPVSSSGHLKLGESLLNIHEPQLLFDIVLHVGSLLSVMLFYRAEIALALSGLFKGLKDGLSQRSLDALLAPQGMRLSLLIVLATIPTGAIGVLLKKLLDPDEGSSPITPRIVCILLIVNGFILMSNLFFLRREQRLHPDKARLNDAAAERRTHEEHSGEDPIPTREGRFTLWSIAPWVALCIGVAQGLAVMPGISRSGSTITLALALGVQRMHAARYSFLLSIPAILGALVLKLKDLDLSSTASQLPLFLAGALTAAGVGYLCLIFLTRVLKEAKFHHFAWYCWAAGILGLILL